MTTSELEFVGLSKVFPSSESDGKSFRFCFELISSFEDSFLENIWGIFIQTFNDFDEGKVCLWWIFK